MSTHHDDLATTPSAVAAVLRSRGMVLSDDRVASIAEGLPLLEQMRAVLWDNDWLDSITAVVPR